MVTPRQFDLPAAEEGLIGALLIRPYLIPDAADEVMPEDIFAPKMAAIYRAMLAVWERGITPTEETIVDELRAMDRLEIVGGKPALTSLMAGVGSPYLDRYIPSIREHALRRRAVAEARGAVELLSDPTIPAADALERAREMLAAVEMPTAVANEVVDVQTFVSGTDEYDWLVPWLIERGERVLVVAGEAGGKSMLLRQLAVCVAFGIHPFKSHHIDARRVLLIDFENPVALIRRKVRPMVAKGRELRPLADPTMMGVLCRPGGIDVTKRSDARWLASQLAAAKPELVVCGPLYKMFGGDDRKYEQEARTVATVLDDLRTRVNFTLILETHAPQEYGGKRQLRPIGSSLWLRWPEFIISFAPLDKHPHVIRLTTMKGRDERQWPFFLERGGQWPWTPCRDPEGPKGQPDPAFPPTPGFEQEAAF